MNDFRSLGLLLPAVLGLWAAAPAGAAGQAATTATYTAAQAENGRMVFEQSCARCHGDEAVGGDNGPPLVGQPFLYTWEGQRVTGLIRFVQTNMPMSAPGTLDADATLAVVAYLLSRNRIPAGPTALSASSAGVVTPPPGTR